MRHFQMKPDSRQVRLFGATIRLTRWCYCRARRRNRIRELTVLVEFGRLKESVERYLLMKNFRFRRSDREEKPLLDGVRVQKAG